MTSLASPAPPCVLVIFGAAGDLTKRLLVPALYNLRRAGLLPENFAIIGVARGKKDDATFRRELITNLRQFCASTIADNAADWLAERMSYLQGEFHDPAAYERLAHHLAGTDKA